MVPPIGTLIHDNFFFLPTFTPRSCERLLRLLLREGTRGVARPERDPDNRANQDSSFL